ncbi:MAG: hypothetical protein ACRDYY_10740 [Acidimicrobiales bacterium]
MKGRFWLVLGALVGIAVAAGHLPYLAGAGQSLADTAERLVGTGADTLMSVAASSGAPRRGVLGLGGVLQAVVPGVTALLLVMAARGSLRLRALVGLLVVGLGAASYVYHPHGVATGVLLLALTVAGLAVALTGPFVAAPLAGLAGLIGGTYLPTLVSSGRLATSASVDDLHRAIFAHPGTPAALQLTVLAIAAVPFLVGVRLILTR